MEKPKLEYWKYRSGLSEMSKLFLFNLFGLSIEIEINYLNPELPNPSAPLSVSGSENSVTSSTGVFKQL